MRAYTIALALFAFGFVCGGLNTLAIFDVALPGGGASINEAQVTDLTKEATSGAASVMQPITSTLTLGSTLLEGLKTALTIIPLLTSYGVHPVIAWIVQGPIWFVYTVAVVQFVSGRSIKQME